MFRYYYMDSNNQQLAIHPKIKKLFKENKINFELFGSGINTLSDHYCSLFYDIEKHFGSKGNFFDIKLYKGIYWCNPPYIETLMSDAADLLIYHMNKHNNIGYLITIPIWDKETREKMNNKKITINLNNNSDDSLFTDYQIYYKIKPYIKYELVIPKNIIPYFNFRKNRTIYAANTYMLFVYKNLDMEYSDNIIDCLNKVVECAGKGEYSFE